MKRKKGRPVIISGINPDKLEKWIKQDKERWAAIKCQVLISLTKDISVTDVCHVLNVTRESLRIWRNIIKNH